MRNNKGINMITLSIAIIILVVITSMLVYNAQDGVKIKKLNGLYNDIETLSSKVSTYYQKYGNIPGTVVYASKGNAEQNSEFIEKLSIAGDNGESVLNPNDSDTYYVLDLQSLDIVTLNYGRDYEKLSDTTDVTTLTDVYVINKESHTIYYPKGITVEGVTYYTDQSQYSEVDLKVIPIYTAEELSWVGDNQTHAIAEKDGVEYTFAMNGIYSLQNDIDLSSICYKVDGTTANDKSWNPIGTAENPFTGTFLGNNYEIKNIYINNGEDTRVGLFRRISEATIEGIGITGNIITTTSSSTGDAGAIAGIALNSTIKDSYNKANVIQTTNNGSIGGIIGYGYGVALTGCYNSGNISGANGSGGLIGSCSKITVTIENCYNEGKISNDASNGSYVGGLVGIMFSEGYEDNIVIKNSYNTGNVAGRAYIGGIIGFTADGTTITNCYNAGDVKGDDVVGGIAGRVGGNSSTCIIQNCYNIGVLQAESKVGGIVGVTAGNCQQSDIILTNNYWVSTCGAQYGFVAYSSNEGAEPKTEIIMKMQAFVDLLNGSNTETVWIQDINNINNCYPILKWQRTGNETTQIWVANADNTEFTYGSGETAITVKIGDYIDYTADAVSYSSPTGTYISNDSASVPMNETKTKDTLTYGTGCSSEQVLPSYYGGWRVLGVENGNLQLISADSITTFYLRGYAGYKYGTDELNNVCSKYGNSNTINARSVNVDDINNVTGYNPNNVGVKDITKSGTGTKYGNNSINEYGNEVIYTWGSSSSSVSGMGANEKTCSYSDGGFGRYGFNYFDIEGKNWLTNSFNSGAYIAKLKSTYYYYYPYTLTTSSSTTGDVVGIDTTSSAYKTLFCNSNGSTMSYWLASSYIETGTTNVIFGERAVDGGYVRGFDRAFSNGYAPGYVSGVRPVVTIKPEITIDKTGKTGESQEEAYKLVRLAAE